MSRKKKAEPTPAPVWIFAERGILQRCSETVVSRVDHKGQYTEGDCTFIVTDRMIVYRSHPLLNLFTGAVEEIWLTREQVETYRQNGFDLHKKPPHPRLFDLPRIGLKRDEQLEGFNSSTVWTLAIDGEGHLWHGQTGELHARPYMHSFETSEKGWKPPELRFMYPHLSYIGPDTDEIWLTPWGEKGRKFRLTIASYKVRKALEPTGMLEHYFPQGKARTDEKLAVEQAEKLKVKILGDLEKTIAARTADAVEKMETALYDLKREEDAHKETKKLLVPRDEAYTRIAAEKSRLEKERDTLLKRVRDLEDDLEIARENRGDGFNLSHV